MNFINKSIIRVLYPNGGFNTRFEWGSILLALKSLLSLFLKADCPLCDRATSETICSACQQQLQRLQWRDPQQFWQGDLPVLAWGTYGGALKRAIAALKYDGHPELAQPLGFWLGKTWLASPQSQKFKRAIVVPLPVHRSKLEQRGFDQAVLIARSFCQYTRLSLQAKGLERTRETQALFGLSPREREETLQEAFALGKDFRQRLPRHPVLLLDDIHTTGTTARTAAQTLRRQGIRVVGILAAAKPRHQT